MFTTFLCFKLASEISAALRKGPATLHASRRVASRRDASRYNCCVDRSHWWSHQGRQLTRINTQVAHILGGYVIVCSPVLQSIAMESDEEEVLLLYLLNRRRRFRRRNRTWVHPINRTRRRHGEFNTLVKQLKLPGNEDRCL